MDTRRNRRLPLAYRSHLRGQCRRGMSPGPRGNQLTKGRIPLPWPVKQGALSIQLFLVRDSRERCALIRLIRSRKKYERFFGRHLQIWYKRRTDGRQTASAMIECQCREQGGSLAVPTFVRSHTATGRLSPHPAAPWPSLQPRRTLQTSALASQLTSGGRTG